MEGEFHILIGLVNAVKMVAYSGNLSSASVQLNGGLSIMNNMKQFGYFNGKITALDKIKISPYDLGFLRGYGVFDVMCTQNGKPFLLDEHWKRLRNSAKKLNLKIPISADGYKKIISKLLLLNKFKKSSIRAILTGGLSDNGFAYCAEETFVILIEKFQQLPKEIYEKGAGVITVEYERQIPIAKICNYVEAIRNQNRKEKNRALEIIYIKNKKAMEASTSNFFIVKNGKLITAKNGILVGTTRNLVIKLAKKARLAGASSKRAGYKVEERDIAERELYSADEVFLTATNKDIVPVVKIDGKKVGDGKVGKNTKVLMEEFKKFVEKY